MHIPVLEQYVSIHESMGTVDSYIGHIMTSPRHPAAFGYNHGYMEANSSICLNFGLLSRRVMHHNRVSTGAVRIHKEYNVQTSQHNYRQDLIA